jgi:hypothetical protein
MGVPRRSAAGAVNGRIVSATRESVLNPGGALHASPMRRIRASRALAASSGYTLPPRSRLARSSSVSIASSSPPETCPPEASPAVGSANAPWRLRRGVAARASVPRALVGHGVFGVDQLAGRQADRAAVTRAGLSFVTLYAPRRSYIGDGPTGVATDGGRRGTVAVIFQHTLNEVFRQKDVAPAFHLPPEDSADVRQPLERQLDLADADAKLPGEVRIAREGIAALPDQGSEPPCELDGEDVRQIAFGNGLAPAIKGVPWPMSRRLWLSLRRLLQVHNSGDCGSPRVSGSTSARRSSSKLASVSLRGLRPPPDRRTRSASGVSPARNSASPRPIVLRAMPVARVTALTPPCPADAASAAAKRRRARSSSTGISASKHWRMADSSITPKRYSFATPEGLDRPTESVRSTGVSRRRTIPPQARFPHDCHLRDEKCHLRGE